MPKHKILNDEKDVVKHLNSKIKNKKIIDLSNCVIKDNFDLNKILDSCTYFKNREKCKIEDINGKEFSTCYNAINLDFEVDFTNTVFLSTCIIEKINFKQSCDFSNSVYKGKVKLYKLHFDDVVFFDYSYFEYGNSFLIADCKFKQATYFRNINFNESTTDQYVIANKVFWLSFIIDGIELNNVIFNKKTSWENIVTNETILFKKVVFNDNLEIEKTKYFKAEFKTCTINNIINSQNEQTNITFGGQLFFEECIFNTSLKYTGESNSILNFNRSIFREVTKFYQRNPEANVNFNNVTFEKEVVFYEFLCKKISFISTSFHKLKFLSPSLYRADFTNALFNDTAKFVNITPIENKKISLNYSFTTIKKLFFIDSDDGNTKNPPLNIGGQINFRRALIENTAFIFIRNISDVQNPNCRINFESTNILGSIAIQNSHFKTIYSKNTVIIGNLIIQDTTMTNLYLDNSTPTGKILYNTDYIPENLNQESACILKNQHLFVHNNIRALDFRAKEMQAYRKKLCKKTYRTKEYKWSEKIVLLLNCVSNKYGLKWFRGCVFTLVSAILFTTIYMFFNQNLGFEIPNSWQDESWTSIGIYWKNVLSYLWIPKFPDLNDMTTTALIFYILGKIIVGYGIYQTIAAFRKHGK